jgi:regulator of chromosome condensation
MKLAVGSNHALALTGNGAALAWGYGEQYQTGRRLLDRTKSNGLIPQGLGLNKGIIDIGTGGEHSFAVNENGVVYAWGLNNFAQAGIMEREGEDFSNILRPTPVKSLRGYGKVVRIGGGNHHSFAVTDKGECLTWGRCDAKSLGINIANTPLDKLIYDARGKARILTVPTQVPNSNSAVFAAAGSDQCLGVTREGKAYSWVYTINGETGQGAAVDVEEDTLIDHPSIRGKRIVWVGYGGHYSVLAEEVVAMTNGTH